MKKGMTFVILLFVVGGLFAQSLGIKGGLNLSTLTGDDVEDAKTKLGFAFGGFYTYQLNEQFAFQPEIFFTMKGAKFEDEIMGYDYEETDYLNYIEVPMLFKMMIPSSSSVMPNLFVGPALAFNISATYKIEVDGDEDDGDIEDINAMDFGLVFGAGADLGKITIDGRYNLGLTNIPDVEGDPKVKNSVISFMLGYKLM